MEKAIAEKTTEILVEIFKDSGWECGKKDRNKLVQSVEDFIKESRAITEGDYTGGYAIISRRIMKSVHDDKKSGPSNTKMGKKLFRAEKKLIRVFESLGMYSNFEVIPQFTLIVTNLKEVGKESTVALLYSMDFGFNPECIGVYPYP